MDSLLRATLQLILTDTVGPITFWKLIKRFGHPEKALAELPTLATRGGKRELKIPPAKDVEKLYHQTIAWGGLVVPYFDEAYPSSIKAFEDAPPVLFMRGRSELLRRSSIAIVGARNASLNGLKIAGALAEQLANQGYITISGMARGIDTVVHEKTINHGTIAVLAGGIDKVYPPENQKLYDKICQQGLVLSEMPLGLEPQARHFPRRNRLVSGLSSGVVVIEASLKSGSLITAQWAMNQGREIFAVPGSPLDPRARGCNKLIRDGAVLTETVDDILQNLPAQASLFKGQVMENQASAWQPTSERHQPIEITPVYEIDDSLRDKVLACLSPTPTSIDDLVYHLKVDLSVISTILLEFELAGRLGRLPGNQVFMYAQS